MAKILIKNKNNVAVGRSPNKLKECVFC